MSGLRAVASRLIGLLTRRRDNGLDEEVETHLALLESEYSERGLSADEARAAARREFGGVRQMTEAYQDQRGFPVLDAFGKDARYATRQLGKHPGFTMIAVLTLAIGIGANTAIFSLADALLLRPLPVRQPEQLRVLQQTTGAGRLQKVSTAFSHDTFRHLRESPEVLTNVIALAEISDLVVESDGRQIRLSGTAAYVSDNYFSDLGLTAPLGRGFTEGEDRPGAGGSIVLSDHLWRTEFGADRGVLGRSVRIEGSLFSVVGVAPRGFLGLTLGRASNLFLPIGAMASGIPGDAALVSLRMQIIGRLRTGLTDRVVNERLTRLVRASLPPRNAVPAPVVDALPLETGLSDLRVRFARPFALLMAMVGLLLLVACANVALMMASRGASRSTELAIRVALGAGRLRLVQQLLVESLILGVASAAVGLLIAPWATAFLFRLLPVDSTPLVLDLAIDARVLIFTAVTSLVSVLLSGLTPIVRAMNIDVLAALRSGARHAQIGAPIRFGRSFVVIQVATCFVILSGAAMLVRTLTSLSNVDPGFKPEGLVLVTVTPGARGYIGDRLRAYYSDLLERLRSTPGVTSATVSQLGFISESRTTGTVDVPGHSSGSDGERWAQMFQVGPTFFATLGIDVLRGRDFTAEDMVRDAGVAAINEKAARRFFGDDDPIGQSIQSSGVRRIIAVVRNSRYNLLRDEGDAAVFVPYPWFGRGQMQFTVRVEGNPEDALAWIANAGRALDDRVPIKVTTSASVVDRSLSKERLLALVSGFFAATALLLMSIGLFGLVTFGVQTRRAEIGLRLALGATPSRVVWGVLRQPIRLALLGVAIGIPVTAASARWIEGLLYGVASVDSTLWGETIVAVLFVVSIAALLPAWRASRLDPLTALRQE